MPNHFHLIVKQNIDGGIQKFMQKIQNSYTKYFNTIYKRVGPLVQGTFKAVPIESDVQLIHVSRYIHLNPYVSGITQDLDTYHYSSFPDFIGIKNGQLCNKELLLNFFKNSEDYKNFVIGNSDYAKEIEAMKHLLLEDE